MKTKNIKKFSIRNIADYLLLIAIVFTFLFISVSNIYADDQQNGSEVIHPATAFIVVDKTLYPQIVEVNGIITVTLNITNTGQNPACSIDIVDYLDDHFVLVPGSVEIYSVPTSNCQIKNQYANPNRVEFGCDRLFEWNKTGNNIFIKFNLTVGSNVNTTKNLSLYNHVNIVNVTAYYASYSGVGEDTFVCTNIYASASLIGDGGESDAEARKNNMTDMVKFTVVPESKISVIKTISDFSGIVEVGDYVNFTIYVTNLGAYNATNIKVNDVLPSGFKQISIYPDPSAIIIQPEETKNISIMTQVTLDVFEGININFVNVSGTANGKNISDTATVSIFVKGKLAVPHMIIEKYSLNPTIQKVGDTWQPAQYRITIRNIGTGRAYNITVADMLPINWTITALPEQSCDDGNIVTWNGNNNFSINTISSGASCSFLYNVRVSPGANDGLYINTARVSGYDGIGTLIRPSAEDSAYTYLLTQAAIAGLQVTKTANNINPEPGDEVNFTINLCNPLGGNIINLTITDYLPYGFDFVAATNTTNITLVNVTGTKITWNISVLEQGMTNCKQINLNTKVNPNVTKSINVNTVFAEGKFGNQTVYGATNLPLNVRKPIIYVKKNLGPGQNTLVMPGENVTYEVEIGNVGDAVAYNVSIEDIVPFMGTDLEWNHTGMPFDISPGWCNVSRINNTFYLNSSLSPSSDIYSYSCKFRFNVSVSLGTGDGQYYNIIKGWAKDKANGSIGPAIDTSSVFIRGFAALEVIKKLSSSQIEFQPGEIAGFNISISNRGQGQISKIDIIDTLPHGLVYNSIICPPSVTCNPILNGNEIHVSFDYTLNPDKTIVIQLFANVTSNASAGNQPNKVTVISTRSDGGKLIDKDIAMIVVKKPYLLIEKWTPSPTKSAGTSATYLIRIKNIGTGTAKNITVFDSMDFGFTHISSSESPKILSGACKNISIINNGQNATFIIVGEINETQDCVFQYVVNIGINVSDGSYPNFATLLAKDNSGTNLPDQTVVAYVFVVKGVAVDVKKTSDVSITQPGDIVNFTIEISNKGDSASSVSIVDIIPYGFYNLSEISWENVYIPAHSTITKNVITRVETIAPEFNLNRVTVSGTSVTGTFSISDFAIVIVKKPHITLSKKVLTENSYAGGKVIYEISVLNEGDATASVIHVADKLPGNFSYVVNSVTKCNNYTVGINPNSSVNEIIFNITKFPKGECKFYFSADVPSGTNDGLYGNTIYGNYSDNANGNYTIIPKTEAYVSILSVTAVSKLFVNKDADKKILEPGDKVTFTINVTNPGLSFIGNVYVEDYMPLGFNITSCETDNNNLIKEKCNESMVIYHGGMPAGTVIIISINATVLSNATEFTTFNKVVSYAIVNNTISIKDDDVLLLTVNKPRMDIKKLVAGNTTKEINSTVNYIIKIKNTGHGKAYNVRVQDSLVEFCIKSGWCQTPPNPVKISGNCSVSISGNGNTTQVYFNISEMQGGSECVFVYNLTVPAIQAGLYENNATILWDDYLGFTGSDTDKAYIQIPCCARTLIVRKEMDKIIAQPGDIIKAKIYVDAIGHSFDVVVKDILPYGWNYMNASRDGNNIVCSQNGLTVNCSPFHMEKSIGTIIELNLRLNSSVIPGNNINLANVSAKDYLNNSYVRTSSAFVYVDKPSIFISKSVDQYQVEPGASPTFTLIISNPSMAKIYNLSVKDNFPIGITYVSDSTSLNGVNYSDSDFILVRKGNYNTTGENITWNIGDLDAKGLKVLTFKARVKCNVTKGEFFNYVDVSGKGYDGTIISANSSVRMTGFIANATIVKYASTNYVTIGSIVDYTLIIHNHREGAWIVPLTMEDHLPVGLMYVPGYSRINGLKIEPVLGGSSRIGYTLTWNLSDFSLSPGGTFTITYRTKVRKGLNAEVTNYASLIYLDPPPNMQPGACPDCVFKSNNASSTIGCYNCSVSGNSLNYTINIHQGWNLISIPVMPLNDSINDVFASIEGKYTDVYTMVNNSWVFRIYYKNKYYGDLNKIEAGTGYWIRMHEDALLNVEGYEIDNAVIPLSAGWNLIGWPSLYGRSFDSFDNISLNFMSIYTFDRSWIYRTYGYEAWLGNLDKFEPGRGYLIRVNKSTVI
ncbi:MAG: hypothetical protein QMD06_00020 [Candidatus Altarchaeum sp.]|nr:hypothetical protein [Candidatus Altarchaeum sp.]